MSEDEFEDRLGVLLLEGADGVVLESSSTAKVFAPEAIDLSALERLQLTVIESGEIEDEPWVQKHEESLVSKTVGSLTIVPVAQPEIAPEPQPHTIIIVPGLGFGTGHHHSTHMMLEQISTFYDNKRAFSKCLDFGCGSGILAIALTKLFDAHACAVDNDPFALENAKMNVWLNGLSDSIILTDTIENDSYDLIVANVYAEALIEYREQFYQCLKSGGPLLLSGILPHLLDSVLESYCAPHWEEKLRIREGDWCSLVLERKE